MGGGDSPRPAPRFCLSLACSLDGYIAEPDGGMGWLSPYDGPEYGVSGLLARSSDLIMGRRTYDQVLGLGGWPYAGKRVHIVTSSPVRDAPDGVMPAHKPLREFIARLRDEATGDVWIVGGGETAASFLDRGAVDELELFVMPCVLGAGVPLFPDGTPRSFVLKEATQMERGVVRLRYEPAASA